VSEHQGWEFDALHPGAYRSLVEGVPAIVYIDRPDDPSTNLYTSPQIESLLGYSVEEWTSDPDLWRRNLHPDDRERVVRAHHESNERGERYLEEYRFVSRDGRTVWLRDEAVPVRGDDGAILFWRGVILDITDRRAAEESLGRARERLQAIVDHIPAVVYTESPDADAEKFYLSPQVESLFGHTVHEWTWTDDFWLDHVHPEDRERVAAEDQRTDATHDEFAIEYRFRHADGRYLWVYDAAMWVPSDDELGFWQGFIFDISGRRAVEEKLRMSLDVLRKTLQQRRELAGRLQTAQEAERRRIAADLHDDPIQVMSAVDMRLQMLVDFPQTISGGELAGIEREVRLAIERLRSLLFELRPAALDREGLAAALRVYLEHIAATTGWAVDVRDTMEAEPEPDLRSLVYRIAQEAVMNARKHAGAGTVVVELATVDGGVSLRVSDDGGGFEPEAAETPVPGHAGLPTVVERAELAGGWARITSAPGEGTIVACWIPSEVTDDLSSMFTG